MTQTPRSDFEPVWQAIEPWRPVAHSRLYRAGLVGELVRGSDRPPVASDLTHLLIPGLAALGIQARLVRLPLQRKDWERRVKTDSAVVLFDFDAALEFAPPEEIDDATPLPEQTDPRLTAQAFLPHAKTVGFLWQGSADGLDAEATSDLRFPYALCLEKSDTRELRRDRLQAALHRWLAWYAAYSERAPREADLTEPRWGEMAAFLQEAIGTRRDFLSNRLRYAARCFEEAHSERAYEWLQEAAVAHWQLPAATAKALLTAPDLPLSDVLRRELIYLARAGTLPLKTLAARRLTYERHHPDARKTLHQLRFDADPWVRAAARPIP